MNNGIQAFLSYLIYFDHHTVQSGPFDTIAGDLIVTNASISKRTKAANNL